MKRRSILKGIGAASLLPLLPGRLHASPIANPPLGPSNAAWPSPAAWQRLDASVGGNLHPVEFPLSELKTDPNGAAAKRLLHNLKNPYYIDEQSGLTQTSGWVDAWTSEPSQYAVAARHAQDIAQAVNFARDNNLRLVVKGGGHSYQGTSCARNSLLIWTHPIRDMEMHDTFLPQGCETTTNAVPAVTLGAGLLWMQAYDMVTTKSGRYVQGGGCLTVGVPGLVLSGGFGSFSKHYGLAAASLLEAEVVTADGQVRTANACTNPDLFWALKGGGGGTFGVVSKVTLRTHDLPEFFAVSDLTIRASSDDAYRRLVSEFVSFYREHLFNDHSGEQAHFKPDNTLAITMLAHGLSGTQAKADWQPLLEKIEKADDWSTSGLTVIGSIPARHFWDIGWWHAHWPEIVFPRPGHPLNSMLDEVLAHVKDQPVFDADTRPGANPNNIWSKGDGKQAGQYLWAYESLWMPSSLLEPSAQHRLASALYEGSRHAGISLHFNKGLAGAPPEAIAAAKDTAMNPAVLDAFALAFSTDGEGFAYPGIAGHEPDVTAARAARKRIRSAVDQLRAVTGKTGSYVSESNYFEQNWQDAYWGTNYPRLASIKAKYDPGGLFSVHNGVGPDAAS